MNPFASILFQDCPRLNAQRLSREDICYLEATSVI